MKKLAIGTVALGLLAGLAVEAQQAAPQQPQAQAPARRPAPPPSKPAPRWPDGRISFSGSPTDVGNWEGPANASIFFDIRNGKQVTPAPSLPTNKTVDQIPFKPGVRQLYDSRWDQSGDPHTRCKPSGGSRFWHTPYGIEIVPTTEKLHLIEKLSRPNHDTLRYEATVDDPGAYTAAWSGGWNLRWSEGNEPFDYLCQENNRDPARMTGGGVADSNRTR